MTEGRAWTFWTFIALLIAVHFILHLGLGMGVGAPDLLVVALLLSARRLNGAAAAGFGLVLGLLQDTLMLFGFGANAVSFTVLGFLGARSRDLFLGDSLWFAGAYLFAGKWLHDVLYYVLAGPAVRGDTVHQLLVEAPLAALYAAVVGVAALFLYRSIVRDR